MFPLKKKKSSVKVPRNLSASTSTSSTPSSSVLTVSNPQQQPSSTNPYPLKHASSSVSYQNGERVFNAIASLFPEKYFSHKFPPIVLYHQLFFFDQSVNRNDIEGFVELEHKQGNLIKINRAILIGKDDIYLIRRKGLRKRKGLFLKFNISTCFCSHNYERLAGG
eukprot:m.52361 g.52361  ORF g.52361 m.52361 type:complete len:165 (-) comp7619_c0_seq4:1239-1733(-)